MKYTIIIRSVKYFLILVSLIILSLLFVKSSSYKKNIKKNSLITFESEEMNSTTQVLKKPLFMGLDKKEQPFKISASKAIRYYEDENIYNLEEPHGEIKTGSDIFFVFGKSGVFNNYEQKLMITGDVEFTNKNSMKFQTTEAEFDFKKQILHGDKKVTGQRDGSILKSEGFKLFNIENKIIFTGKSSLKLINNK